MSELVVSAGKDVQTLQAVEVSAIA